MDVRAIGQMNVARKLVEFHLKSRPLFKPINTISDNSLVNLVHFHATADFGEERNGQLATEMLPEIREPLQHQRHAPRIALPQPVVPQVETKPLQKTHDTLVLARSKAARQNRIARVERDTDGDSLAVIELIFCQLLELVRGPMTEIQRTRRPHFERVAAKPDLAHVKLGAGLDKMIKMRPGKARKRIRMGFEPLEKLAVAYQGNLHGFSHACSLLAQRQHVDEGAVIDDRPGRRKGADQVLETEQIDGVLDADAAVILCQDRRRKANVADATMKDRRRIADRIKDGTAADRNYK